MHKAPAVSCVIGTSTVPNKLLVGALSLAFALNLPLLFSGVAWSTLGYLALAYVFLALVLIGSRASRNEHIGRLSWDGMNWAWTRFPTASPCHVAVRLDIQTLMLVHVVNEEQDSVWLWLERSSLAFQWLAFRRAVYAVGRSKQTALTKNRPVEELF